MSTCPSIECLNIDLSFCRKDVRKIDILDDVGEEKVERWNGIQHIHIRSAS